MWFKWYASALLFLVSVNASASPVLTGTLILNGKTSAIKVAPEGAGDYAGGTIQVGGDVYKISSASDEQFAGSKTLNDDVVSSVMILRTQKYIDWVKANLSQLPLGNVKEVLCDPSANAFVVVTDQSGASSGNCTRLN